MQHLISASDIHPDIEGSDHCPVSAVFKFRISAARKPPPWATKNFPEFQGKQLSIKDLFAASVKRERSPEITLKAAAATKKTKKENVKITNFFAPKSTVPIECESAPKKEKEEAIQIE